MPVQSEQLDGKQLAELMKLIDGADSVELKLTIPDAESRNTMVALDLDPIDAQIRKLYSKQQRAFYDSHAPDGIGLDDLHVLGPITVIKLKWQPVDFKRRMVAELWFYPDGSRILELSTKCNPSEAFQVAAETRAFLTDRGIKTSGEQQTKTKTALEFYTKNNAEAADPESSESSA